MNIKIFNVAHGFCACVIADNGSVLLVDCGHDGENFRPSGFLRQHRYTSIQGLIISNYDEDHISDLPGVLDATNVDVLYRNKSVTPNQLRKLKLQSGQLSTAMTRLIAMAEEYSSPVTTIPDYQGIEFSRFYNDYPTFDDTNNLSIVTFVEFSGMRIAFTGDVEKEGWDALLDNPRFRLKLTGTDIFVASHHGRESGYNEKVFEYCTPQIVIISDKEIVHETQKNKYSKHAKGILWDDGPQKRYVLTTRSDGHINIEKTAGQGFHVTI